MTREEREKAIDALKISAPVMAVTQEEFNDYIQTLNKIMNWLEQEPCKDAIKYFNTIYELSQTLGVTYDFIDEKVREAITAFKVLPPVTPTEKVGHWIDTDNYYQRWKCSECGCHTRDARPDYCSNCGAKMQEVEE